MRGKVLFVVINTFTKQYQAQFPGLRGAIMFTSDIAPHDNNTVFLEPANEQYTSDQVLGASCAAADAAVSTMGPQRNTVHMVLCSNCELCVQVRSTQRAVNECTAVMCRQVTAAAGRVSSYAEQGYMVRVRSDYDTLEARANDTSRVHARPPVMYPAV